MLLEVHSKQSEKAGQIVLKVTVRTHYLRTVLRYNDLYIVQNLPRFFNCLILRIVLSNNIFIFDET